MPRTAELIHILEEARLLLSQPENDFTWSSWEDSADASEEIDRLLSRLRAGVTPAVSSLAILFAPTGPMQEVSLSSGWGDEFSHLADRFEAAMVQPECSCPDAPPSNWATAQELGMDDRFAEVSIVSCAECGQLWVRYFYENEAFTSSGQWYLGAVSDSQRRKVTAQNARSMLAALERYFCGGSYYDGRVSAASGEIRLNP